VLPLAVANGELRVADIFVDRRIDDPRIADLCKRVRVTSDPRLDPLFPDFYASIVEIETRDGRRLERRNDIARGYPETPLSQAELDDKFDRLCGSVTDAAGVARLRAALDGLPEAPTARAFADALREARGRLEVAA
jgi:2-methylcitrate dehydratase PrpD